MAGKHYGNSAGSGDLGGVNPPFFPGDRLDKAYNEGRETGHRGGSAGDNPYAVGTPEYNVWDVGLTNWADPAEQHQTAYDGSSEPPLDYEEYDVVGSGSPLTNGRYERMDSAVSITGAGPFTIVKPALALHRSFKQDAGSSWRVHCWNPDEGDWIFLESPVDPETLTNGGVLPEAPGTTMRVSTSGTDGAGFSIPDPDHPNITYV